MNEATPTKLYTIEFRTVATGHWRADRVDRELPLDLAMQRLADYRKQPLCSEVEFKLVHEGKTVDESTVLPAPKVDQPLKLPTDDAARKGLPVFRGPLMYFPNALLEVARVCKVGNDQHNPGQPMHWARGKSTEQMDTALRHMMDHGLGSTRDTDGTYHLAKAAWRVLAELQLTIERDAEKETK